LWRAARASVSKSAFDQPQKSLKFALKRKLELELELELEAARRAAGFRVVVQILRYIRVLTSFGDATKHGKSPPGNGEPARIAAAKVKITRANVQALKQAQEERLQLDASVKSMCAEKQRLLTKDAHAVTAGYEASIMSEANGQLVCLW
jgi:hypothetical protein